ncbi:hypothetical protein PAAL109150_22650 [Paenibacillus alkaliterrae]
MNHYIKGINSLESDVFIYKIMKQDNFIGTVQLCRFNTESKEAFIGRFLIGEDLNRERGVGKICFSLPKRRVSVQWNPTFLSLKQIRFWH